MKDNASSPFDNLTKKSAVLILVLVLPLYFIFAYLGDYGRARAAAACGFILATTILLSWHLKDRVWYFPTLFFLLSTHTFIVVYFSWSDASFPGRTLLPLGLADLFVSYGLIKLVEKVARLLGEAH